MKGSKCECFGSKAQHSFVIHVIVCIGTLGRDVSFSSGRDWLDTEIKALLSSPGMERTLLPSPSYHINGFWPKGCGQT